MSLQNGRLQTRTRVQSVVTDASGQFTIGSPLESGPVIAAAPVGIATVSIQQVRESGRVQLQPYGGIEGSFIVGGQPVAEQVFRFSAVDGDVVFTAQAITDEEGRFAFTGIPPGEGELVRLIRRSGNFSQPSHNQQVRVRAGQITQVKLGETGAILQGRIRFESPPAVGEKLTFYGNMIPWMSAAEQAARLNSPAWRSLDSSYEVVVAADGSFRVDSVPPGTYLLTIGARKSEDEPDGGGAVASGRATITVPEGDNPNAPIRLEEILLRTTSNRVGP